MGMEESVEQESLDQVLTRAQSRRQSSVDVEPSQKEKEYGAEPRSLERDEEA